MNREIEDLGKKLRAYAYDMKLNDNDDCQNVADFIVTTLGYRKSADVAREIFAEIYNKLGIGHDILDVWNILAELRKKYESEGANDEV